MVHKYFIPFCQFSCFMFTIKQKFSCDTGQFILHLGIMFLVSKKLCLVFILDILCSTSNLLLNNFSGINVCNNTSAYTLRCLVRRGQGTAPSICLLGGSVWLDFRSLSALCIALLLVREAVLFVYAHWCF